MKWVPFPLKGTEKDALQVKETVEKAGLENSFLSQRIVLDLFPNFG